MPDQEEFERGKQCLIEGIESLIQFYEPFLKLFQGLQLLGLRGVLG